MPNRNTGPDRGESGRPGQRPWQDDPAILARMREGARLRASGLTGPEIAHRLGVDRSVVYEDRKRLIELSKAEALEAVDEHVANLRQQQREIVETLEGTDRRSLNVGQLRGLLRQIEMDIAKLDGSLIDRREVTGKDGGPIEVADARDELLSRLDRLAARGAAEGGHPEPAAEDG